MHLSRDAGEELCMLFWDAGEEPGEVRRKHRICSFWDVPTPAVRRTAVDEAPVGLRLLICALSHVKMGILCAFRETVPGPRVSAVRTPSFR